MSNKKNLGYRQMLRDRMPKLLSLALIWCKAKERWIDYVYEEIVKKYPKEKRSDVVKVVLGIKQQYKRQEIYDTIRYAEMKSVTKEQVSNIPKSELYMSFSRTINWQKLVREDSEMIEYWSNVIEWVEWFKAVYSSIEDTYNHMLSWRMSEVEMTTILMDKYGIDYKLVKYLIKSFK